MSDRPTTNSSSTPATSRGVQRILDDLKIEYVEFDRIKAFDLVLLGSVAQTDDQVNAFDGAAAAREQITTHNVEHR